MFRQKPSLSNLKSIFTSNDDVGTYRSHDIPRNNHLLAALPRADYEHLLPHLEHVPLPLGSILHSAGVRQKYLYFITSGIVSLIYMTESGAPTEYAVKGREGVAGIASFLGGESTTSQATVLSAGYAFRIRSDLVKNEIEHNGALLRALLIYTQALITQIGQIAMCNRNHSLEQQLCRWILLRLDRMQSNELSATHELIADLLGVRREGVTQAAVKLQETGLLHYRRGHIAVVDRSQLENHSCECYMAIKQEYDRLLHPESSRRQRQNVGQAPPAPQRTKRLIQQEERG